MGNAAGALLADPFDQPRPAAGRILPGDPGGRLVEQPVALGLVIELAEDLLRYGMVDTAGRVLVGTDQGAGDVQQVVVPALDGSGADQEAGDGEIAGGTGQPHLVDLHGLVEPCPVDALAAFVDAGREHGLPAGRPQLEQHAVAAVGVLELDRFRHCGDVEPMRVRLALPAEDGPGRRQKAGGQCQCLGAVEIDVRQASACLAHEHADVEPCAVEVPGGSFACDPQLRPIVVERLLAAEPDRDRRPAAPDVVEGDLERRHGLPALPRPGRGCAGSCPGRPPWP